ncbi:hypothetical protein C1T17_12170 [Sphingobium sp. SCG-1]|nr:hypothetical protein C1T17_12170 [Sphingobium sp. SCG-1]
MDIPESRDWTTVAPLESFVAVTVYFDELVRVILPLTKWWHDKKLETLRGSGGREARSDLENAISARLGRNGTEEPAALLPKPDRTRSRVLEATSIIALIGVFVAAAQARARGREEGEGAGGPDENSTPSDLFISKEIRPDGAADTALAKWTAAKAREIARAAISELQRPIQGALEETLAEYGVGEQPRGLIQRVFLDRQSQLADVEAVCTVKADAAERLFNISCSSLTWAIIDCGIAASHPAFAQFGPNGRTDNSRIRATYDLTMIDLIRNFDLTTDNEIQLETLIQLIIIELRKLPGTRAADFDEVADKNLRLIATQLRDCLLPDWGLIEPLIKLDGDDGDSLRSDHGTHVAGILAGNWCDMPGEEDSVRARQVTLQGVCPDIWLYDLRVLHPKLKNTEFAVIAALEFVRHINSRAAGPPVIHGVNISLSIPHEVRNYGCGVTPICIACDDLVQSGAVVVAAAGNRGWDERELGFGNFVFCSITDPGNAQQVITVGATHKLKPHSYGVSYFSSRGPTGDGRVKPDLVAPGEKIRGPIRGDTDDELDGTSMAAPFVSGAAAMLMARNRELMRNPQRIKKILCESATDLGRERYFQGHGLVDVLRALQSI